MRTTRNIQNKEKAKEFLKSTDYTFKFPNFADLKKIPSYSGSITTLLDEAQQKIKEYVRISNHIEKNMEKEAGRRQSLFDYKKMNEKNSSNMNLKNQAVLVWLFKFVFSMDDFWLRQVVFFEYKLNILRFIDRITTEKKFGGDNKEIGFSLDNNVKMDKKTRTFGQSTREQVFHMMCFLILHEHYFIEKFGRPAKLLVGLTDDEWVDIIRHFLRSKSVPVESLYREAAGRFKEETLLDRFNQITGRIEAMINSGEPIEAN